MVGTKGWKTGSQTVEDLVKKIGYYPIGNREVTRILIRDLFILRGEWGGGYMLVIWEDELEQGRVIGKITGS